MAKEEKNWMKLQEQRITAILILTNVLEQPEGVSVHVKSAIASSLMNMMETSMLDKDDEPFKNIINNAIDNFCLEVEESSGIENYRAVLEEKIKFAKKILKSVKKELKAKADRIKEGDDILKGICLN
jgi:hypothetical protein